MEGKDASVSFTALKGQERAKTFLGRVLSSKRLAHAYLFRGPDGVGKQLCARIVAAAVNCAGSHEDGGCGSCRSCRKFITGNHPDISVISPEKGTIGIDRIRELSKSLSYPPYESEMRVVILEDVHTMRAEAGNSLLKTLEEPPENNLLILTAESSSEVLPTITSRCQSVPFFGLPVEQCSAVICSVDGDIAKEEAAMLSQLAEGSPGKALLFREKGLVKTWKEVIEVVSMQERHSVSRVLKTAELLAALKDDLQPLLGLIRIWLRDRMLSESGSGASSMEKFLLRLASLENAERQLARNCNRALVCEVLLFNLQSPEPRVSF